MIEQLEKQLEAVDVEERRMAVLQLARRPLSDYGEHIRLLLKAMLDANWRVRKTTVDVLIDNYPVEYYINGLISLLYLEDNAGARNSAIEALTRLGKKITSFLIEAYNTKNSDVKKFIVDIIGQSNDRKALPFLIAALRDEDENVRASVVEYLGNMGEPSVVDALIEILESGDLWAAYPAADALGRIGDKRAMPALLRGLEDRTLREPVLKAIGKLAGEESLGRIAPYISERSKSVAYEAVVAIEKLYHRGVSEAAIIGSLRDAHGERLVDVLLEHAWSNRPDVRGASILFLGLLKDERALTPLLELSSDDDFREDIKRAMVYIGREKPDSLLPLYASSDVYLRRFLCEVAVVVAAPSYYDVMLKGLEDDDGHIRALAATGLSNIGDKSAVEHIMKLLDDPYIDVQEAAVKALVFFKDLLDLNLLKRDLEGKNPVLKKNVILLLGRVEAEGAVPAIGFCLKDEDVSVRRAVVSSLSFIKSDDAVRYLTMALTDEDPDIRSSAALFLGASGSSIESLRLLLSDADDMVRVSAAKALGMIGDEGAIPDLVDLLQDRNGFVITSAIESLAKLGGDTSRLAIAGMLGSEDREIRITAIRALASFHDTEKNIIPFLKDKDWALRAAAVESLIGHRKEHVREEIEKVMGAEEDPVVKKKMKDFFGA